MKRIKQLLTLLTITILMGSCSVNSSKIDSNDFDTDDITYVKDGKSGLCFGVVASRKSGNSSSSGLGFTCVPCKDVEHLLED